MTLRKYLAAALGVALLLTLGAACTSDDSSKDNSNRGEPSVAGEQEDEAQALDESADDPEEGVIQGTLPEGETLEGEDYSIIEGLTAFPRTDRRYLCGYATHIFVGDVVEETGEAPIAAEPVEGETTPELPQSQFIVEPVSGISNIKGTFVSGSEVTASDAVTTGYVVNQSGGQLVPEDPVQLMDGDPLLVPGERYVFATTYNADNEWYQIVIQPEGDRRVSSDSERDKLIRFMKKSCHYEKTPEDNEAELAAIYNAAVAQYNGEEGALEDLDLDPPSEIAQYSLPDPDYVLGDELLPEEDLKAMEEGQYDD